MDSCIDYRVEVELFQKKLGVVCVKYMKVTYTEAVGNCPLYDIFPELLNGF